MRLALWTTILVLVLTAVYIASPMVALSRIGAAVEARDGPAVTERIDFPAVRRSFRRQIARTYREMTGKTLPLNAMASRLAVSVADPVVARLMAVNALMDLLGRAEAGEKSKLPLDRAPITARSLDSAWRLWLSTEYLGRTVIVRLPPEGKRAGRFGLKLRLSQWTWKISGIDLPRDLREKLAEELIEAAKAKRQRP